MAATESNKFSRMILNEHIFISVRLSIEHHLIDTNLWLVSIGLGMPWHRVGQKALSKQMAIVLVSYSLPEVTGFW